MPRNTLVQLAHGMFGQTGFRLVSAPTFLPAYLFMLSGSDFAVGLARSLQAAGTIATPMIGASLIAHRSKILGITLASSALMRLQILGLALVGFFAGAGAAVPAIIVFLTLMGTFQGIAQVTMNSLRAKVIPIKRRGIVGGARNFLAGLTSAAVSYAAGAYLIDGDVLGNGYASVFLLAFGVTSIGLVALAFTAEPKSMSVRGRESIFETFKAVGPILRSQHDFRRFFIARALASGGRMALPFYILFAGTRMELTGTVLGILTTVWMLTSSTANLGWGMLADRHGYKIVMLVTLACWIASHVQLLFVEGFAGITVFFVLMGAASGGFNQSAQNMVLEFGRFEDIPIRLAASGSAVNLIATIGPVLGGAVVALLGYIELFVLTILLQAVAFVIMAVFVPDPRHARGGKEGGPMTHRIRSGSRRWTNAARWAGVCAVAVTMEANATPSTETAFVLNTFAFLVWGALVMWMCAGFTMLEAGSVRTKNASVICLKNIGLYSIAGLAYYVIGYNLMYTDVGSVVGSFTLFHGSSGEELALIGGDEGQAAAVAESGYSTMSNWFFQMVFVATAASIVSGTLAERVKLWSFFVFVLFLTAFIYPIVGAWTWGEGWLYEFGFKDFAGSTIVHSTGGWAALAGALVVGPRLGKYRADGSVKPTPPSNIPAVTLGVFILWLGWFGFNGGSQLALAGVLDAVAMSNVLVNTNLAAAAGVMAAVSVARPILGRVDLLAVLNGAIAGLVSITAGPDIVDHYWAIVIGAIGGVVCTAGIKLLETIKIDDVVGAVPAHLFAGVWGTLAVCIAGGGDFVAQIVGILAIGAFVFSVSWVLWFALDKIMSARVSATVEQLGQDVSELGIEAYPEFVVMPDADEAAELAAASSRDSE